MSNWFNLNPKIAAGLIVAAVIIVAGPQLKASGIDVTGNWQTLLALLAGYLVPGSVSTGTTPK
jgi:hypothetical protein